MDAVDFIASVAQLAGAGLSLSKVLYEYVSSVSNAPKKLNDLAQDVKLTSSVLEHLGEVFSEATVRALYDQVHYTQPKMPSQVALRFMRRWRR
jgi:hypothetical protein